MAASTLFMPTAGPLSKRLFNHVKLLAQKVINDKYKSVEIVLAFMTHIPWIFPGDHTMDDETCIYISIATTIAFDLSLHKTLMPRDALESGPTNVSRGECLDPRAALAIDGFPDVDPWSEQGQLLLRARERCYISLFVVERGMSLARGRPFMIPITRNIKDVDTWHRSPLADEQDGPVASMAAVRRDLDSLFNTVRALCDGSQTSNSDGSLVARSIQGLQTSGPPKPTRPPKPRRTTPSSTEPMQETPPAPPSSFMDQQVLWPDMVQFSTMSDDQITQVLNQPGNVFEPSFGGGMSWEDMNNFDWLNWPAFNAN